MNNERKLVTIRRIKEIKRIPDADAIEIAVVDGWQCVVKKGMHWPNERVLYFEIDSFLPEHEEFEFLRASSFKRMTDWQHGFRLRTIKLRGQLSQGLVMKLDVLHKFGMTASDIANWGDEDLAPYIGVIKWDPPLPANLAGEVEGFFPSFIPKTDQERIQNCYEELHKRLLDDFFEVTLKLDGSSMTVFLHQDTFGVCSRNMQLKVNDENKEHNAFVRCAIDLDLESILRNSGFDSIAIQGELMGPGVQGNREKLNKLSFYVFDMYNINTGRKFNPDFVREFCFKHELDHAPIINPHMSLRWKTCAEILEMADKAHSIKHEIAEGLVFKSVHDSSVSFKAISNRYLLEE